MVISEHYTWPTNRETLKVMGYRSLFLGDYSIWAAARSSINPEAVNEILIRELGSAKPRFMTGPDLPAIENLEITDSAKGESTVVSPSFTGSECREASRFIEQALGKSNAETLNSEYYNTAANENKIENTNQCVAAFNRMK